MHTAIAFASEDRISRSPSRSRSASRSGRSSSTSSVASSAYGSSVDLEDARTGRLYRFGHKEKPRHHEVMLPEGAPRDLVEAKGSKQLSLLWNAVEAAERRKDSQVARHLVLALPDSEEVTPDDRIELVRSFARKHFVSEGLGVQFDIHAPEIDEEGDESNWHAHLLITTRRFLRDPSQPERYFEKKKARDLDPVVRSGGRKRYVAEATLWGEEWRAHQDRFFRKRGYKVRVDPNGVIPQKHMGVKRSWVRRATSELAELEERVEANRKASHDPEAVMEALTRHNAIFTERELDRYLEKHLEGEEEEEIAKVREEVLESRQLVRLLDPDTQEGTGLFTTRSVRRQERKAMAAAADLTSRRDEVDWPDKAQAAARSLREDQRAAFEHAISAGDLKLIEGRAGTGKSYTLNAVRDAFEQAGKRVVGLAPTNVVARDMGADGFRESGTVHSALFKLKNGREEWDENTVVMVDEAAMLGAEITGELLEQAREAGAKLILVGDDRQLASIERGGLFSAMLKRYGSAEITGVERQQVAWQREAAEDLAQYRFAKALTAFDTKGAITWTEDQEDAREALVEAWSKDAEEHPGESRFVFAYTNADVDELNAALRKVRRERGELTGKGVTFLTTRGSEEFGLEEKPERFAEGDRVQFTKTDKELGLYNGNVGTITGIDKATGDVSALIDGDPEREVTWNAHEFQGFKLGYAGTIYKAQGKTLDRTYLYHTDHWRAEPGYVALTRQRRNAQLFVARETAPTLDELALQMERRDLRCASLDWVTQEDEEREKDLRAAFEERRAWYKSGKQRFQESASAHREDHELAKARDWVRDWYQLAEDFYQTLGGSDQDKAYRRARKKLLAHVSALDGENPGTGRALRDHPEIAEVPSDQGSKAGPTARDALRLVLQAQKPSEAVAGIVEYIEAEQRAEAEERQRKDGKTLDARTRIDTRG